MRDSTAVCKTCFFKTCFFFQLNKSTFTKIEESTEKKNSSEKGRATIIFSLKNEVGGLVKALRLFQVCPKVTDSRFLIQGMAQGRATVPTGSFHINEVISVLMKHF